MKKQSNFLTALGTEQVTSLTNIIAETLAPNYKAPAGKSFTAAELWNIQRQKKTITHRRHIV